MQVTIESIKVEQRVRTDMGDLTALKESMSKHGQISPILLTRQHVLIAGHRRLTAARELGWHEIEAVCVDKPDAADQLELELQENVYRKDFTPEELLAGYRKLDKLRRPGVAKRIGGFFRRIFGGLFRRKKPAEAVTEMTQDIPPAEVVPHNKKHAGENVPENEIYGC